MSKELAKIVGVYKKPSKTNNSNDDDDDDDDSEDDDYENQTRTVTFS